MINGANRLETGMAKILGPLVQAMVLSPWQSLVSEKYGRLFRLRGKGKGLEVW